MSGKHYLRQINDMLPNKVHMNFFASQVVCLQQSMVSV